MTRERIVLAAAEAFDQRGYLGVNLKDVVDQIGLTKGALYYFFPTKEDLAVEIVNRHYSALVPIAREALTTSDNKLDALVEMTYRAARIAESDPIARAGTRLSMERNLIRAELPRPFELGIGGTTRLLEMAKSAGQVRADVDPAATAEVLMAFFFGAHSISRMDARTDLVTRLEQFWLLFLPALRPILELSGNLET
ncbi:MAG: TetR/AcrR family transcriptional regulator [Actinomycetota bacterium]|nr:TetR/AcrR family transcriptional regulator [Actinomycetota bacterium]